MGNEPSAERRAGWLARLERWDDRPLTVLAIVLIPLLLAPCVCDLTPETEERAPGRGVHHLGSLPPTWLSS